MDTSQPIQPISPGAQDTCMDTPGHPKPAALAPGGTAWAQHPLLSSAQSSIPSTQGHCTEPQPAQTGPGDIA